MVREGLHGIQQLGDSGAEQTGRHSLCHILSGQIEHTRCGHQVNIRGGGVTLHRTQNKLQIRESKL